MKLNFSNYIIWSVIISLLVAGIILQFAQDDKLEAPDTNMPTFADIQQMLVESGHNIKVDGKICKGWNVPEHSETLTAWDLEICNQEASKMFKRMEKVK